MKHIYAVLVKSDVLNSEPKLSQECYSTLKSAKKFVESRSDKPREITEFLYVTDHTTYEIHELTLVRYPL